jgi:hypothetical protein
MFMVEKYFMILSFVASCGNENNISTGGNFQIYEE